MRSLKDELKGFDLAAIRRRAEAAMKENPRSTKDDGTTPTYRCQKCRDEGGAFVKRPVTMTVHGQEEEVMMDHWQVCPCIEQVRVEKLIRSSQISIEFQKKTFDSFSLEDVHDTIREAYRKA